MLRWDISIFKKLDCIYQAGEVALKSRANLCCSFWLHLCWFSSFSKKMHLLFPTKKNFRSSFSSFLMFNSHLLNLDRAEKFLILKTTKLLRSVSMFNNSWHYIILYRDKFSVKFRLTHFMPLVSFYIP